MKIILTSAGDLSTSVTKLCSSGSAAALSSHILCRPSLTGWSAGQWRRRCSRSPMVWLQVLARQKPSLLSDQNLQRLSVLYLPLIILAKMVDLFTSYGLLPAAAHRGCGVARECLRGLKWLSEMRGRASAARRCCQYSTILVLTSLLNFCLDGGLLRSCRG